MLLLQRHLMFAILILFCISLPLPSSGLQCECKDDNCDGESTCTATPGGICYAQYYSDVTGMHWTLRKGCLSDPSSVICQYTKSDTHINGCCDDRDNCNADLLPDATEAPTNPTISCNCVGSVCHDDDQTSCTLRTSKHSCYTTIRRVGTTISYERGCVKNCADYENDDEIRTCCHSNMCNNDSIPSTWPLKSLTVTPSKTSDAPLLLTEATPAPPTTDSGDILTSQQPTTIDPRHPRELICHCSGCINGGTTCSASVACATYTVGSKQVTSCIRDEFTCENNSFQLTCCYSDYCNGSPKPSPGPPCDDEDSEQSGGCEFDPVTSSTALPSTTTTTAAATTTTAASSVTSTEATPTSSSKATPTDVITENSKTQYDDSNMMVIFYFFIILLSICIIMMIVVIVACVGLVCHYRGMAYKTILSSSTILESAMKEKGYPISNSPPV